MSIFEPKYKPNQTYVKVVGIGDNRRIKLGTMSFVRTSGLFIDSNKDPPSDIEPLDDIVPIGDFKLSNSIRRTKNLIFELASCNPWDLFFTGTLDKSKYDRTDLNKFRTDLSQWLRDNKKRKGYGIKYLFIPELHSDGKSWHIHGLIRGIPENYLSQFSIGDVMGKKLADKVMRGDIVYNWPAYADKFGFCDLEPIRNSEALEKYITKYITKDLAQCVSDFNAHMFYASQGLKRAEVVAKGFCTFDYNPDFECEYYKCKEIPYTEENLQFVLQHIISDYWE